MKKGRVRTLPFVFPSIHTNTIMKIIRLSGDSVLVLGDVHAYRQDNIRNSGTGIHDLLGEFVSFASAVASRKKECCAIIQVGDLYDQARPDKATEILLAGLLRDAQVPWFGITGNHEFPSGAEAGGGRGAEGDNACELLEKASGGKYIYADHTVLLSRSRTVAYHMVPFFRKEEAFLEHLRHRAKVTSLHEELEDVQMHYIIMHQDVKARIMDSIITPEEVKSAFKVKGEVVVLNGHIHNNPGIIHEGSRKSVRWINLGVSVVTKAQDAEVVPEWTIAGLEGQETFPSPVANHWASTWARPSSEPEPMFTPASAGNDVKDTTIEQKGAFLKEAAGIEVEAALIPVDGEGVRDHAPSLHILSVTLQGFRSWAGEATYHFDHQGSLTILRAPSGAGKSTLFEAPCWAVTGEGLKENMTQATIPSLPHLRGRDWQGTRAIFRFRRDGVEYAIARHISYTGDTWGQKGKDSLLLARFADGQDEPETTDAALILDMPSSELDNKTKLTAALCRWTGITRQSWVTGILFTPQTSRIAQGSQADLRKILEPLMGTAWVDILLANAKARELELQPKVNQASTAMQLADQAHQSVQRQVDIDLQRLTDAVEEATQAFTQAGEDEETELGRIAGVNEGLEKDRQHAGETIAGIEKDIAAHKETEPATLEVLELSLRSCEASLRNAIASAKAASREHSDVSECEVDTDTEYSRLSTKLDKINQNKALAATDRKDATSRLSKTNERLAKVEISIQEAKCHECGQHLATGTKKFEAESEELRLEIEAIEAELLELDGEDAQNAQLEKDTMQALNDRKAAWETAKQALLVPLAKALQKAKDAVAKIEGEHGPLKEKMQQGEKTRNDWQSKMTALESSLTSARQRLTQVQSSMAVAKERGEVAARAEKSGAARIALDKAAKALEDFNAGKQDRVQAAALALAEATKRFNDLGVIIANVKETIKACAANGPLRKRIIGSRLDNLNRHAWEFGAALGIAATIMQDDSGNFRVKLMLEGYERDASTLSDGQAVTANLILMRAVHALSKATTLDCNVLLLDEPFGNHDPATTRLVSRLLRVPDVSVHCITHATEVDMQDARIFEITGGRRDTSRIA